MSTTPAKKKRSMLIRIVSNLLLFFCLAVIISVVVLKRGISLDHVTLRRISVSNCHLVWRDKLELQLDSIAIKKGSSSKTAPHDFHLVSKTVDRAHQFARFFSRFSVNHLMIGGRNLAIDLHQQDDGSYVLDLQTADISFQSHLLFDVEDLVVEIDKATSDKYNSSLSGQIRLEGLSDRVSGAISTVISDTFPVSLDFVADNEQITFQGREAGVITTITPLVDLFGLSHNIQRWITDYLSGSRYHLKAVKGQLHWDNPIEILDTLEAEVRVDDTQYTFAPGLEPIKGRYTDVFFKKGVLIIKPHDATFYGQDGGESWLDIDFNDPQNILLTAYIKTRAVANDDVLTVLNHYKIGLPFRQVGGETDTDLQLAINLRKKKVTAEGLFEIDKGTIEYKNKNFQVQNAKIKLEKSDITIDSLKIAYQDIIQARVVGEIQAKKKIGDLDITLEKLAVKLGDSLLNLDKSTAPLHIDYSFSPEGNVLEAAKSSWFLGSTMLNLGALRTPVFPEDLAIELPSVSLETPLGVASKISGYLSIKKKQADITCDILHFDVKGLELKNPHLAVDVLYDDGLDVRTSETAVWHLNNTPVTLYPSVFRYGDDTFTIRKSKVNYNSLYESDLTGSYNRQTQKGSFKLKMPIISNDEARNNDDGDVDVLISNVAGNYHISAFDYGLKLLIDKNKSWSMVIEDFSTIYNHLEILQKYRLKEGSLRVRSSENGQKPYIFTADSTSPYPLLIKAGQPVEQLHISGQFSDQGTSATVNSEVNIQYNPGQLKITSTDIGFNIPAFISMLKDQKKMTPGIPKNDENKHLHVSLIADKSVLYLSKKNRTLADHLEIAYMDGQLKMKLIHGEGSLVGQLNDGNFMLFGSGLNDTFMEALIQRSDFKGGTLAITAMGGLEDVSAVIEINNTTISNLKTVNNVMAFLNTFPALVNFSLPEYSESGLAIDSAIIGLKYTKKLLSIESLEVHSPEIQAVGSGSVDLLKRVMDVDIYLTTEAGRNISNVPVIGYIMAGDQDEHSVALKVKGSIDNPEVEHTLVTEILSIPHEMLYRTLNLPFHLFDKSKDMFFDEDK